MPRCGGEEDNINAPQAQTLQVPTGEEKALLQAACNLGYSLPRRRVRTISSREIAPSKETRTKARSYSPVNTAL